MQSSPSSSSSSPLEEKPWPPTTVHRVDIDKVVRDLPLTGKRRWERLGGNEQLETVVRRVVELYNLGSRRKDRLKFERIKGVRIDPHQYDGFRLIAYEGFQKLPEDSIDQFVSSKGGSWRYESTLRRRALFFVRNKLSRGEQKKTQDIFFLAKGQGAWNLVRPYRDFEFLHRVVISAGDVSSKGINKLGIRPLIGGKYSKAWSGEGIVPSDSLCVVKTFQIRFRQEPLPESLKEPLLNATLAVLEGGIRLNKQLTPRQFCALFNFYSDCCANPYRGFCSSSPFVRTWEAASKVDEETKKKCNVELVRAIYTAFCSPFPHSTYLRFCPPNNSSDYFAGHTCLIVDQKKKKPHPVLVKWEGFLTASQVIQRLRQVKPLRDSSQEKTEAARLAKFTKSLNRLGFKFKFQEKSSRLSRCFEGEVILTAGSIFQHYFRLDSVWYSVHLQGMETHYDGFQKLLENCLITSEKEGFLSEPWQGKTEPSQSAPSTSKPHREKVENTYNRRYEEIGGYLVGDEVCPRDIELFDILGYSTNKLYVYQVKEGFNNMSRYAAEQIRAAAQVISDAISPDDPDLALFESWAKGFKATYGSAYERLVGNRKGDDAIKYLTQLLAGQFCRRKREDIVFVYAFADKASSKRSLEDELALVKRFTKEVAQDILRDVEKQGIITPEELIQSLAHYGFLSKSGQVRFKLLKATFSYPKERVDFCTLFRDERWKVPEKKELLKALKKYVGSQFRSVNPRFSLVSLKKKIESLGFTFGICQIPNKKDDNGQSSVLPIPRISEWPASQSQQQARYTPGLLFLTKHEGIYQISSTRDQGLAPLHAALGKWNTGVGMYCWAPSRGKGASLRSHFVKEVKRSLGDGQNFQWVSRVLLEGEDHHTWSRSLALQRRRLTQCLKRIGRLDAQTVESRCKKLNKLKLNLRNSQQREEGKFREYFKAMSNARKRVPFLTALRGQEVTTKNRDGIYESYRNNHELLLQDYRKNRKRVWQFVKGHARQEDRGFKLECKTLRKTPRKLQKKQKRLGKLYLECLQSEHYVYGVTELKLLGLTFNKKITLYTPNTSSEQIDELSITNEGEPVPVFFAPYHNNQGEGFFYRCTPSLSGESRLAAGRKIEPEPEGKGKERTGKRINEK